MISISLIEPLRPETSVGVELEPRFEPGATDPPPPQESSIAKIKVMKYFIIFLPKKNYLNIIKMKKKFQDKKPSEEGFFFLNSNFSLQAANG